MLEKLLTFIKNELKNNKYQIDHINIGGTNLLYDTKKLSNIKVYDSTTGQNTNSKIDANSNFSYVTIPTITTGSSAENFLSWISWKSYPINKNELLNKDTVLSFEYNIQRKNSNTTSTYPILIEYYITNTLGNTRKYYTLFYINVEDTVEWKRLELKRNITNELFMHITDDSVSKEDCTNFVIRIYGNKDFDVNLRKFKFEIGNKGTDWSPSPEDIENQIDTKSDKTHIHDDRYYKKSEVDTLVKDEYKIIVSDVKPNPKPGEKILWVNVPGGSN